MFRCSVAICGRKLVQRVSNVSPSVVLRRVHPPGFLGVFIVFLNSSTCLGRLDFFVGLVCK